MSRLTVIIHAQTNAASLRRCLQRLLGQDFTDFDILIYNAIANAGAVQQQIMTEFPAARIAWLQDEKRPEGVTPDHYLLRRAQGDIVLKLSDDTYFVRKDFLSGLVEQFDLHEDAVAIVPKIIEKQSKQEKWIVPFSKVVLRANKDIAEQEQFVSYFTSLAFAVRQTALQRAHYTSLKIASPEEAHDLSYRLVRAGYQLFYQPDLVVMHQPAAHILAVDAHIQNRFYIAYQYLPTSYAIAYMTIWILYYSWKALTVKSTGIVSLYKALTAAWKNKKNYKRQPMHQNAIDYLAMYYGRLWY